MSPALGSADLGASGEIDIMRYILAMHRVAVAVTHEAPIFELAVPCEVFGIPRRDLVDPWYDFRLCPVEPARVTVASGLDVSSEHTLDDLVGADTVIVPACANVHASQPPALVAAVRAAYERGARIVSLCSGAFVLAAAGLLDGRRATTHWMHAAELVRRHPLVRVDPSVLYVDDGRVFTSAGTAAGIDLCLELVRRDHGSAVANALARRLVVPPHRSGGQAQYVELPGARSGGDELAGLADWVIGRLDQPLTLHTLAAEAKVSTRTLARRFAERFDASPMQWLAEQRIRRAQELLETGDDTVERIAGRVGLGTAANLRKHFVKTCGVSPAAYRRTFRRALPRPA
jgi:AraC family transcriptional regulator, transcriptional activator FtrA